jgi:hypothetical protein
MAKSVKKSMTSKLGLRKRIAKDKSVLKAAKVRLATDRGKALTTAVVSSVKKAMGSRDLRSRPGAVGKLAWDATNKFHLPLPMSTGPYSVIRVTKVITTDTNATRTLFGPMVSDNVTGGRSESWENVIAVENAGALSTALNAASGTRQYTLSLPSMGDGTTLVPSAFTVTVMNGNALQTTSGVCYMGRMNSCPTLADSTRTWDSLGDLFVSYHSPRLLSASKLALGAVRCNAIPSNMSALQNFSSISTSRTDGTFTWNGTTSGDIEHGGFAPIVFIKPAGLILTFQVVVEFRIRFDPDNVASSTHIHHKPVSDTFWNDAVAAAVSAGHGVYDVAEVAVDAADAIAHI